MKIEKLPSYAKINLFLKVNGKYENGYHKITTLFQSIDLHDEINIEIINDNNNFIKIKYSGYDIPIDESNTMYKAINILREYSNKNFSVGIDIKKSIPVGAGLGGGSSNSAIILYAIAKSLKLNINKRKLTDIAKLIGADVAFFLYGGTKIATERGDCFINTIQLKIPYILLVIPNFSFSTKEIYKIYDKILTENKINNNISSLIMDIKPKHLFKLATNDLEYAVKELTQEVENIKKCLYENGARMALMTGSGSCVYGIFDSDSELIKAREVIEKMNYNNIITRSIGSRLYWQSIKNILQKNIYNGA